MPVDNETTHQITRMRNNVLNIQLCPSRPCANLQSTKCGQELSAGEQRHCQPARVQRRVFFLGNRGGRDGGHPSEEQSFWRGLDFHLVGTECSDGKAKPGDRDLVRRSTSICSDFDFRSYKLTTDRNYAEWNIQTSALCNWERVLRRRLHGIHSVRLPIARYGSVDRNHRTSSPHML